MKRNLRSNFWIGLAAGLLLFLTASRASAVDFDFNVPNRGGIGVMQIARVKIVLTMANPPVVFPDPGADELHLLDAPGSMNILGSRAMTTNSLGGTIDGFRVQFSNLPAGSNQVIIDIEFQSKFTPVGSFCNPTGAFPFNVALRYDPVGGNSILSHRFGSYSAPGDGTTEQCQCQGRRVNVNAIAWGQTPPGAVDQRLGYDVVLVLDRSGSMGDPVPVDASGGGGMSEVKMTVMKAAVSEFIDQWRDEPGAPLNDRLAIIGFDSSVAVLPPGSLVNRNAADWNALKALVNAPGFAPGSATAMGDGISRAVDLLETNQGNDGVIVVMTNGMQNTGNRIIIRPTTHATLLSFRHLSSGTFKAITAPCFPMQCIGVGAPASIPTDTLNAISEQTGGKADQTVNAVGLTAAFGDDLVEILKGNTMSLLTRTNGTLPAGTSQVTPAITFNLDNTVRQANVVMGWFGSQNALKLELFAPGNPTPVFKTRVTEPLYNYQSVELPTNGNPGVWRAEISRNTGNANVPFYISIYTFEAKFSARLAFKAASHGTGDDIILTAALGFGAQPLKGQSGGLKVEVKRPPSGLDNLLHQVNVAQTVLTTPPSSTNPSISTDSYTSRYERKLFHLLQTTDLAQAIEPKPDPQPLTLFDDGNPIHGDAAADDGIYSARYSQTRLPGRYRFKVTMNLNTPNGPVNRVEDRDTEVNVLKIDPTEAEVNATHTGSGNYRLDIVPADRFGNFLGPGYGDQIVVTLTGPGTVLPGVVDERENGTYTVQLTGVTDPATTRVKVTYLGQPFADGTVREFTKPKRRFAFFGGIGGNFPQGDFNSIYDSGVSTQLGFEYMFTNRISAEGTFGYDRFSSPFLAGNLSLYRGSANLKVYPVIGTFQLGLFGGGGVYHFNDGGGTHGGLNIGAVSEFRINTTVSLEGTYNFHNVFTSGSSTRFSTVQAGVRFRF